MMISIVALSTDMMLPALGTIGADLRVANPNDTQLVISALFLGFATGQIIAGPVSDSIGRKPVIYAGYVLFMSGCLLAIFATDFTMMLAGRVLQGLGASCPRIITIALVRDCYQGRVMARIMSIIMAIFIIVPVIAPSIGQAVVFAAGWRAIFVLFLTLAVISSLWFAARQPETLPSEARRRFSLSNIFSGIAEICSYRTALGYTLGFGFIKGAFLGYLSSAQQVFQISFETGLLFPIYFGIASFAIGAAALLNSKMVMRFGMRFLTWRALIGVAALSAAFIPLASVAGGVPPLWQFMAWQLATFFCMGIIFGNLNALAMEPLGHMAGLGAAFVGSVSTFLSLPIAWAIGYSFDGGVLPLVTGFTVAGLISLSVMAWTERKSAKL
ncbi:MAG: multidrug effflux MFS transporter [Rhizobiales bacterium]|nr:multidrug effflux MFS transporter [Hyphomicrobiales bacterium]